MAKLTILEFPDPRLRTVAAPIAVVDDRIRALIADMLETMYDAPGIGLAATQVDVHQQVIVIDISEEKNQALVFINPQLEVLDDEIQEYDEGCLSVPGFYEPVCRPAHVRVRALDGNGKAFQIEPQGLLAICIQHEIDHLHGKLYVDYLSPLKRSRIKKKLQKQQRADA